MTEKPFMEICLNLGLAMNEFNKLFTLGTNNFTIFHSCVKPGFLFDLMSHCYKQLCFMAVPKLYEHVYSKLSFEHLYAG